MAYSAMQVANAFISKAKDGKIAGLTPMKLQKLMFFAQSWYYKLHGFKLFNDYFERWPHGPVLPAIYHEFKSCGAREISQLGTDIWGQEQTIEQSADEADKVHYFLDKIIQTYGQYSGPQLSWMTHQSETAWSMGNIGTIISDQDLLQGKV